MFLNCRHHALAPASSSTASTRGSARPRLPAMGRRLGAAEGVVARGALHLRTAARSLAGLAGATRRLLPTRARTRARAPVSLSRRLSLLAIGIGGACGAVLHCLLRALTIGVSRRRRTVLRRLLRALTVGIGGCRGTVLRRLLSLLAIDIAI